MASVLVVLAIVFSACTSASKEKYYLEERVPGESFSFHCSTNKSMNHATLYKGNKQMSTNKVLHIFNGEEGVQPTYEDEYKNRVTLSGPFNYLSVNIIHLTEEDSGVYWCQYRGVDTEANVFNIIGDEVVALLVKRSVLCPEPSPESTKPSTYTNPTTNTSTSPINFIVVLISIITAVVVLLMFAIMLIFFVIPKIKKLKAAQVPQNRGNDSVYEVMSTTLRRT